MDNLSRSASAARTRRLGAVEETPQEVRQNDKHKGVQQQTAQLGNALACCDPAAEQLAGQLKCHGAGDGDEGGKGDDLLNGIHLIRVYKLIKLIGAEGLGGSGGGAIDRRLFLLFCSAAFIFAFLLLL